MTLWEIGVRKTMLTYSNSNNIRVLLIDLLRIQHRTKVYKFPENY